MRTLKSYLAILSLILTIIVMNSCEFSVTTAHIENVEMCTSLNGDLCDPDSYRNDTKVFSPEDQFIYISCNLNNAPSNTIVTFLWKYMSQEEPIIIDEVSLNSSDMGTDLNLNSNLSRPYNGWPVGEYEVEIIIEDSQKEPFIKKFKVR